jgi:hypothetical protein
VAFYFLLGFFAVVRQVESSFRLADGEVIFFLSFGFCIFEDSFAVFSFAVVVLYHSCRRFLLVLGIVVVHSSSISFLHVDLGLRRKG